MILLKLPFSLQSLTYAVCIFFFLNFPNLRNNLSNLRIEKAVIHERQVDETDGSFILKGMVFHNNGRYREAIHNFQQVDQTNNEIARVFLSKSYLAFGDWRKALECLTNYTRQERFLFYSIFSEHLTELSEGEVSGWQQRIQKDFPQYNLVFANQLLKAGSFDRAISWIKSDTHYIKSDQALIILGSAYFYLNNLAAAEETFREAYRLKHTALTAYWYGRTLFRLNQTDRAIPYLIESVQKAENNFVRSWYLRELSLAYAQDGQCQQADTSLNQARIIDPTRENEQRVMEASLEISAACTK